MLCLQDPLSFEWEPFPKAKRGGGGGSEWILLSHSVSLGSFEPHVTIIRILLSQKKK